MSLDQPNSFVKHQTRTRDAFLGGAITVSQPRNGFRAGLDSVLLGAAVRPGAARLLELGAGVGTAALVAMAHNSGLDATLVERDAEAAALARDNLDDNGFAGRGRVIEADVTARGAVRTAAGIRADFYTAVIANPPYFDDERGTLAEGAYRSGARHMDGAAIDLWVKTAATSAAPGGEIIFIYPAASLPELLPAFAQRFGGLTVLPLSPRPEAPANRVLVRATKGSRAPMVLLAGRPLHGPDGRAFAPAFEAVFRGSAVLDW